MAASGPINAGNLAGEGGDPRLPSFDEAVRLQENFLQEDDDTVTFEEYVYYAAITRAEEKLANEEWIRQNGPTSFTSVIKGRFSKGVLKTPPQDASENAPTEKISNGELNEKEVRQPSPESDRWGVNQAEWKNASRAMRTASWGSIFFLITTDILGPFSTPWAFAQMGYGPGVALFTVFGVLSLYSGWLLWKAFLDLDSDRYPMRNYAQAFYRVWGRWTMHVVNVGQALQLLLTVSVLILGEGQAISQMSQGAAQVGGVCFIVCLLIFTFAGFVIGQIRTLQRFAWLANFSVWINILCLIVLMVLMATYPPNFTVTENFFGPSFGPGPIHTYAGTPPAGMASGGVGFTASLNGLNQAVYSYGGAMLFISFLSEMRNPMDFWKGLICAELLIYVCYMFFGIFVYSYQGQYTFNPIVQGISNFQWQTALNALQLYTGLVAAALYGNVGLKVAYVEVLERLLKFPALHTTTGKFWWAALIPIYWAIGFIVAAAIPQFNYVSSLVGAIFILSFTYTFPAILAFGFYIRRDAMDPEQERFDPSTRTYNYVDTGMKRWVRGFMKRPFFNTWNFIYFLGGLATTGLGAYSSVEGLIGAFASGIFTSFTCKSPV